MLKQFIAGVVLAYTGTSVGADIAAPVIPTTVAAFKDWAVGCDNGLSCQAVALSPENATDSGLSVIMTRAEGTSGALSVELSGFATGTDRYRIVIDRRVIDTGVINTDKEVIALTGAEAMKLVRAMARGRSMLLVDGDGQDLGSASLSGVSASLRYIDVAQGRAGSKGAIIATGRRAATAKKGGVPTISASRIAPSEQLPDTASLVALSESSPCAKERFGATEDSAYSLGPARALILLNCGSGAYNYSVGAYLGSRDIGGKWTFAPALFDYAPYRLAENGSIALLVNAGWDGSTQTLSSYSKGRGIGDCGTSQQYVWDGRLFRLVRANVMDECRGSLDWITVWRANVKLTA